MRITEVIEKKRDGHRLSCDEIQYFVTGYTHGEIPDYQAAALLMAIVLRGMDDDEVRDLTMAMAQSGEVLDLSDVAGIVVDKHSTGGIGDKVSLVVAPVVAALGLPVGKMSGRGLGFSGGTLDKLESIPGYRVDLTVAQFKDQLRRIGVVLTGQSANLAPADAKLYALRDVTGTVPSLPLIVSSIMSKKIASGADAIVLDVKVGTGAFMRTLEEARALAVDMVRIGDAVGRKVSAYISDMNEPLGAAVGNSLEVVEALATLGGHGPQILADHCIQIAGEMLYLGDKCSTLDEGMRCASGALTSGAGLAKFRELVEAQGGDVRFVDDPARFRRAPIAWTVSASSTRYLATMSADEIGLAVVGLGGGREKKGQQIDHAVGVVMHAKVGDLVHTGQPLFTVHARCQADADSAAARIGQALRFSDSPAEALPSFYARISAEDIR
ncbi:MAG: thymidine phosphorylase [Anaerolineae bacterium]|jgi:pyrimidine-nucleoside phosphorylase|nr:thymidine phosphorylase [Anaerolineae bacterium]